MPDHHRLSISGKITHVFGHRFVVQTSDKAVLADLTPKGAEQIALRIGDEVKLTGEMKPTELKVTRFTCGDTTTEIEHKKKHEEHGDADPRQALQAARAAGFDTVGEPRRKPKHFEVLGRRNKELIELHIELDGHIRKTKPVDRHDPKWHEALHGAA
jgi:hypothetical protein